MCNKFGDIKWNTCCEVQRWARENGCPWTAATRDEAADYFGYTDDLGNLVEHPPGADDEFGYGYH